MLDEISLAKVICRAHLEKTLDEFKDAGSMAGTAEPAVRLAMEREIANKWQKFLPEARAVIKAMETNGR